MTSLNAIQGTEEAGGNWIKMPEEGSVRISHAGRLPLLSSTPPSFLPPNQGHGG